MEIQWDGYKFCPISTVLLTWDYFISTSYLRWNYILKGKHFYDDDSQINETLNPNFYNASTYGHGLWQIINENLLYLTFHR